MSLKTSTIAIEEEVQKLEKQIWEVRKLAKLAFDDEFTLGFEKENMDEAVWTMRLSMLANIGTLCQMIVDRDMKRIRICLDVLKEQGG